MDSDSSYPQAVDSATYTNFNEDALKSKFRYGLKPHLKVELARLVERPETLEALMETASRIDAQTYNARDRAMPPHFRSQSVPSRPFQQRYSRPQEQAPMEIGAAERYKPLSNDEKQRRRTNGLCLYCGKPNHVALHCPEKRKPATRHISAATKPVDPELLIDVDESSDDQPAPDMVFQMVPKN